MQWSVSLAAAMSKGRPRRGWFLHRSACRSLILTDTRSRGQRVRTDLRFAKSNPPAEAAGLAEFIHLVFTILGFIAASCSRGAPGETPASPATRRKCCLEAIARGWANGSGLRRWSEPLSFSNRAAARTGEAGRSEPLLILGAYLVLLGSGLDLPDQMIAVPKLDGISAG
jgi:hypothetical protein